QIFLLHANGDQIKEDWIPNHLGTNYSYQLDVDNFKCVDNFLLSTTIKRLSLKRRPRVAINNGEKPQSGIAHSKWHSAESLSSSNRDETRLLGMLSSATRGRPPLPPQHSSYLDSKPSKNEGPIEPAVSRILNESKPQPSERALASQRQSPMMKKTTIENNKQLDQEMTNQPVPQPHPRRRLASFGGVSSPGSLSPFTGLGAYNQNNNGYKPTGTGVEMHLSSSHSSRGSTGCLRLSPEGSGRTTSATGLGTIPLQHVRDQMVVALQKLKELEEQVKIIPILQVKISVLQEEKRQLGSQLKNRNDSDDMNDATWKKACGMEKCDIGNKGNADKVLEDIVRSDCTDLGEFRQITAEMQALERTIKGGSLQGWHGRGQNIQNENGIKSVTCSPTTQMRCCYCQTLQTKQ
uniref:KN motif and ankyrin repeat domains 1b n=1 Tax=Mola mola TaxID=94237 RepID=A0A3Q3W5M2_MOLML